MVEKQMNEEEKRFLDQALEQVKYKKIHGHLRRELQDHIECLREEFERQGMNEEEAYNEAIVKMGNPEEVGKLLHKQHKPEIEWSIFSLIGGLMIIGFLTIYSLMTAFGTNLAEQMMYKEQILFGGIGIILMLLMYRIDYTRFEKYTNAIYMLGIAILVLALFRGVTINGFKRWFCIGGHYIDAAAISFLPLLIGSAGIMRRAASKGVGSIFRVLGLLIVTALLMIRVATTITYVLQIGMVWYSYAVACILMKPNSNKNMAKLLGISVLSIVIIGIISAYNMQDYQWDRIRWIMQQLTHTAEEASWQTSIKAEMLEHARWIGGSKIHLRVDLNAASRDYLLLYFIGRWGYLAFTGLMTMISLLIYRSWRACLKIADEYGRLICIGLVSLLTMRFIVGIMQCIGPVMLMSSYIPFISYDVSNLLSDLAMMGVVLGIYRRKNLIVVEKRRMSYECE